MNDYQPLEQTRTDELVIDNLETLKVIADQLRKRIMEHFDKPSTVKEVARKLNTSPSKLYYHVNLLEEHGLLKVTDTRIVSGIIEKQYQAAARVFRVKAGLLSPTPEDGEAGLNTMLGNMLDQTKADITASVRAGLINFDENGPKHLKLNLSAMTIMLTPTQAETFYARLMQLLTDASELETDENTPDALPYVIQFAMFPADKARFSDDNE
jgi:DNA-binding transcriptional ArsR family regulator